MKASEYFRKGRVNHVDIDVRKDGSVKYTIYKRGWKKAYSFVVINCGKKNERILEDEEIEE